VTSRKWRCRAQRLFLASSPEWTEVHHAVVRGQEVQETLVVLRGHAEQVDDGPEVPPRLRESASHQPAQIERVMSRFMNSTCT
jgi:hypothetical protein